MGRIEPPGIPRDSRVLDKNRRADGWRACPFPEDRWLDRLPGSLALSNPEMVLQVAWSPSSHSIAENICKFFLEEVIDYPSYLVKGGDVVSIGLIIGCMSEALHPPHQVVLSSHQQDDSFQVPC